MYNIALDHPEIVELQKHVKVVDYKKGEIILRPYDQNQNIYAIGEGLVKVYRINSLGEEVISVIYGPDAIFPMMWIIEDKPQHVYFQALTACKIGLVPKDSFLGAAMRNTEVAFALTRKILEQFGIYASRVDNLGLKYARERLAYQLLVLAVRFGVTKDELITLPHISQQDLAAMIHLSRESVSREIKRFEKHDLIEYRKAHIIIKNPDKLRQEIGKDVDVTFYDTSS